MNNYNLNEAQGPDPKRLLLAVVSVSALFMLYSYFFPPTPMKLAEPKEIVQVEKSKNEQNQIGILPIPFNNAHQLSTRPDLPKELADFTMVEDKSLTDERLSYKANMTNYGGLVYDFSLMDFSENQMLINPEQGDQFLSLFSIGESISLKGDAPYEVINKTKNSITYRHITPEGLSVERNYEFLHRDGIRETIWLENLGAGPKKIELSLAINKFLHEEKSAGFLSPPKPKPSLVYKDLIDYKKISFDDLIKEEKSVANFSYLGFDEQYFLQVYIPKEKDIISRAQLSAAKNGSIFNAKATIDFKSILLMPMEKKKLEHQLFMGPKQVNLLASMSPSLEDNVEFGWLSALCRPMLWMLVKINHYVGNFGLAIILLTLLIKLLTYPLMRKSFKSQEEMKKVAPKIKEMQKKYSHDRTMLGQKQMELYREHGINPMAGCLPLLIQLPVWFALYRMLGLSVELFDQPFYLWITDLTKADPYYILPLIMGLSMLLTQVIMPPQMEQPEMKYVMWAMPIVFTFVMLTLPSGLSLYILTNNLVTICQQLYLKNKLASVTI